MQYIPFFKRRCAKKRGFQPVPIFYTFQKKEGGPQYAPLPPSRNRVKNTIKSKREKHRVGIWLDLIWLDLE